MHVIVWHDILSPHQSAHLRALAAAGRHRVTVVAAAAMTEDRIALGWSVPDFGSAEVILAPEDARIRAIAAASTTETVHIFPSVRSHVPMLRRAFDLCAASPGRIGLMSETSDFRGWKGFVRGAIGHWRAIRYGRRIAFVLAMGRYAPDWFRRPGYPADSIYPYGYFMEPPDESEREFIPEGPAEALHMLYLGRCTAVKGIELLLGALEPLRGEPWMLHVIGDGERRQSYECRVEQMGLGEQIRFYGARPNREAMRHMRGMDLFVLPTLWDGWGAVVSEALMRGVPVVCSDIAGASALLRDPLLGDVFPTEDMAGLTRRLQARIAAGKTRPQDRRAIEEWARCISGESAAEYLSAILDAVFLEGARPRPPWEETPVTRAARAV